jgi:hypothetical protein
VGCIPDLPAGNVSPDAQPSFDATLETGPPAAPFCGDGIVQLSRGEQCDPGPVAADAAPAVGCSGKCLVDCNGGVVWTRNDHCYIGAPEAVMINDAITRCSAYGKTAHVVTLASDQELATVVGGLDASSFWVGMYQGLDKFDSVTTLEPAWEPGCDGCYAHTPNPEQPLPGPADASTGCVQGFADLDASWQQIPCVLTKARIPVICEWEPPGRLSQPCEGGQCFDLRFTYGTKHYVYQPLAAGPDEAEQQCEAMGGTLVVLESRDEREQLWKELSHLLGNGLPGTVWIGLSMPSGAADWTWADDASADAYAPVWAFKQPRDSGTRVYLLQNGGTPPAADDTLGHVEPGTVFAPYVCQMLTRDE